MKYANYKFCGNEFNNIGDQIQILAIDYLYHLMGIQKEDIVYIDKNKMSQYDGDQVFLPISMPLVEYKEHGIAGFFSKKIIPVFLGLTLAKDTLSEEEIDYYKCFEPIGCRDERTFNTLSSYGIDTYLGGCITALLPQRIEDSKKQQKIFIIDPTKGVLNYIPENIKKNAIWDTHMIYHSQNEPRELAIKQYRKYFDEAKLVITSLLHCSVPCMAFGIPVILAKDEVSYRFSWLEKLLPIYTPEEYNQIDWNGIKIEYGEFKQKLQTMVLNRLRGVNSKDEIQEIHNFYMERERKSYVIDSFLPLKHFLNENWTETNRKYEYAIWGLTQMAEYLIAYIKKNYPNAVLKHVYDLRRREKIEGILAEHPDNIKQHKGDIIFVTSVAAVDYAKNFFKTIDKPQNEFALLKIII